MYAKLFGRITESSLMEETIETRYVFVMLLAIADPGGNIIGTDVALARRLNMPVVSLKLALASLMEPDPDSNSREREGRRIIACEGERGYHVVNHLSYRSLRDEEHRREYMRQYVAGYRAEGRDGSRPVNSGKLGKLRLAQAEGEAQAEVSLSRQAAEIPSLAEAKAEAAKIGLAEWVAEDWFQQMEGVGWKVNGQPVVKWQTLLARKRTWWESDGRPMSPPSRNRQQSKGPRPPLDHSKGF